MSESDAIATIRAALGRLIEDYDGAGINAETTKQVSTALTASNVLVLLRAYDQAATAAPVASDKARLDFGCIVIHSRDEFGEPQAVEHRGIDLRAAIDAAIRMELRHP